MIIKYSFVSLNVEIVHLPAKIPEKSIDIIIPWKFRGANILSSN